MDGVNTFSWALTLLNTGHRLRRRGWNGKGQWVALQRPDENSKMNAPYLYLNNTFGVLVPWVPSQGDLFAHDWEVSPDAK